MYNMPIITVDVLSMMFINVLFLKLETLYIS